MYQNIQQCLRDVYRFGALRIEPQGNTGQIMAWCESKGVGGSKSGLTQEEWHANARMIQNRIERLLSPIETAAIECEYGKIDLYQIVDLSAYVLAQDKSIDMLLCDALLENLFTERPKQTEIMDKFDVSKGRFWRQQQKVKSVIGALLNHAEQRLDNDFRKAKIITPAVALTI